MARGGSAKPGRSGVTEVWETRREGAGWSPAYVSTAALDEVRGPPVREHLFNDVAPAPAPEHSFPVLVAHVLQEARGWGRPCCGSPTCPPPVLCAYSHLACPFPGPAKA